MHDLQLMHVCNPESTFLTLNCIDYHLSSLHGLTTPPKSASSRGQRWWRQWRCCESDTAPSWRCPVDLRWCIFALLCFSFDCIASYWDALLRTSHRGAGEKSHTYLRWCITELNMSCEKAQNIGVDISQVASARTPPNSMQCVSSENDSSGAQNQERPKVRNDLRLFSHRGSTSLLHSPLFARSIFKIFRRYRCYGRIIQTCGLPQLAGASPVSSFWSCGFLLMLL